MKAKDYMIGDWVLHNDTPYRIISVEGYGDLVSFENEKDCQMLVADYLEPIPLTEDILKANFTSGRVTDFGREYEYEREYGYMNIVFKPLTPLYFRLLIGSGMTCIRMSVTYVHELQHVLRLCGMNNLADNFKVEEEQ